MKLQTTKKQIRNNFANIISIGYCDIQYLLYYSSPFAYSASVYGWSCDYYQFGNVCISTGYSPIGNHVKDYKKVRDIDDKARSIVYNYNMSHEQKIEKLDFLIGEFLKLETK